ncbi:MAG: RNA-binding protein [Gammaproteobacteria bacterium]|nr:RNA-binding protein [Gammaproteobacteria bacterium]
MTPAAKALTITAIIAVTSYFLAPVLGLAAGSLSLGILLGGIIATVIIATANTRPRPAAKAPNRAPARAAKNDTADSRAAAPISSNGETETLFVGNLAFRANRHNLMKLFAEHGTIINARIVTDRATRKPKGYGFVEVNTVDADNIVAKLDGADFFGRELKVSRANKRD